MAKRNEELWRKVWAYSQEFTKYITKKANNDNKMPLALTALLALDLYQFTEPILSPKCPEDYQAQIDALKATLDRVLDFLHSPSFDKETNDQLSAVVTYRLKYFLEFLGRCAGVDIEFEVLSNEGLPVIEPSQPDVAVASPQPGPGTVELVKGQAEGHSQAFAGYYNQLIGYIWQKADKDKYIPVALMGFETAYLFIELANVLIYSCPNLFSKQHYLGLTADTLKELVSLLNYARTYTKQADKDRLAVDINDVGVVFWRELFLMHIAWCFGVDMDVVLVPKGNSWELSVVRYELVEPAPEQGSQGAPQKGGEAP